MLENLLSDLKNLPWYRDQIEHVRDTPPCDAVFGHLALPLPKPLTSCLGAHSLKLYTHQVEVITHVRNGKSIILTTPTASGKSLAYNLPVFERLYTKKTATALYLYPFKALANDQLTSLKELEDETKITVRASVYDGDTHKALRPKIRQKSRIIVSNPHALHQYLPRHDLWERFFANLEIVVIDEAHWYRGVLGSQVALLFRRLLRILRHYGSDPQFILASATIANPEEHALKLTGKAVEVVKKNGAAHGTKHFLLWNSLKYPDRSAHRQASGLLAALTQRGLQTLCFSLSRKMAELVALWAQQEAPFKKIVPYRAGYPAEDRRAIERGLRTGEIDAVVTTNALELGIDIGRLDAVILSGYPGTLISTWQQAGRAGRGRGFALVVLVALEDPLDQYLIKHPDVLFDGAHEHAVIDLQNERILSGQLKCAAAELPVTAFDQLFFGQQTQKRLEDMVGEGGIGCTQQGFIWTGSKRPVDSVHLDNIGDADVELRDGKHVIERMDLWRALYSVHPGAVFIHQGEHYVVETLDLNRKVAGMRKETVDFFTQPLRQTHILILEEQSHVSIGRFRLFNGRVRVRQQVTGYRVRRFDETLSIHELDLPPSEFDTVAFWLIVPVGMMTDMRESKLDGVGGLHAAEHALIHMMPLFSMCDKRDVGGLSTDQHAQTGEATIFIYDGYNGGIGIAQKGYELFYELARSTHGMISDCACETGCPSCIYDRNCGNSNQTLDKTAARKILAKVPER